MRMEGRAVIRSDMAQLIVNFRDFANAPKNCSDYTENAGRHRKKISRPRPGARDLRIPNVLCNGIHWVYVQINHSHPAVEEIFLFYRHSLLRPTLGTRTQYTCSHSQYHRPRHLAVAPLHSVVPLILATTRKLYLHTPRRHARRTDLQPHSFLSSALHGGVFCDQFKGPAVSPRGIKPGAPLIGSVGPRHCSMAWRRFEPRIGHLSPFNIPNMLSRDPYCPFEY
jgi:hypothetical protein